MNIVRIYAMVLRHFYNLLRSFDRLSDVFYWPSLDIILWGLIGLYFLSFAPDFSTQVKAIVGAILLWIIPWRAQNEISINVLVELWDRNLGNVFISPFKFSEWVISLMLVGVIKGIISVAFTAILAYFLYGVSIFIYGYYLIPFAILLFMFGWAIGFTVGAVILRFGSRIQTLGWTVPWAAAPFSAIYFPVSILPSWAANIAKILPSSYVFEVSREVVFEKPLTINYLLISFLLAALYLAGSIYLFKRSYNKALERGLHGIH